MNSVFMNTYHRLPLTFTRGEGSRLFDVNNKKYLDFGSGIAVNLLGHNYPPLVKAISEQTAKFLHVCNYYQSDVSEAFAQKLVEASKPAGMKNVFLANSGAEANEGACKIARKYSLLKYGEGRHTIVTLKGSFHGRTITTLSATGQEKFHRDFGPFTSGFVHIPSGDLQALDKALDKNKVAGLMIEAVQGESGIVPQSAEFMKQAVKLCEERDILLMFDEIQCGLGRTGTFFAFEQYCDEKGGPIKADIVTLAKGLSGGIPSGAVLAGEKTADVFKAGDHGSTFGGNPVAAAAGLVVLDAIFAQGFMENIKKKGDRIICSLKSFKGVNEVRGKGLMIGFDINSNARAFLEAGINIADNSSNQSGLLMLASGDNTIRLLPPYIISESEIEEGLEIISKLLADK